MRIPRSRGAVSGVLLIVLGVWAALAPLIGPSFDFTTDSTSTWSFTNDTIWLSILPGAAAIVGGFILITSANRATAMLGAWLGIAAGAWLVAGDQITGLSVSEAGEFEKLFAFEGLGAAIAAIAALALGRLAVRSVRDVELAREAELEDRDGDGVADHPRRTRESGRFDREPETVRTTSAGAASADSDRGDTLSAADHVRDVSRDDEDPERTRRL
ncbi:MAG: DUF308 domain-containing protein [Solirubrobacteraceae bacterium]